MLSNIRILSVAVFLSVPCLAAFDPSIVPTNFVPSIALSVIYTGYTIDASDFGELIPLQIVQTPPIQITTSPVLNSSYVLTITDPDAPAPYANVIHLLAGNITSAGGSTPSTITNTSAEFFTYLPPAPGAGSGPHRYHVLLYKQPENWVPTGLKSGTGLTPRISYNISDIVAINKLVLVGAVYFETENTTAIATNGSNTTTTTASPLPSATGGAGKYLPSFEFGVLIGSFALLMF